MNSPNAILRFFDNGIIHEIRSSIQTLKKESDSEVLYTNDGHRIPLENLVSMNGVSWM